MPPNTDLGPLLRDRVAVVTGGSRGIGAGIAAALVGAGARVIISGRRQAVLEDTAREIGAGRNVTGDDDAPTARLRPGDDVGMVETHTREGQGAAPAPAGAAPGAARRKPTN